MQFLKGQFQKVLREGQERNSLHNHEHASLNKVVLEVFPAFTVSRDKFSLELESKRALRKKIKFLLKFIAYLQKKRKNQFLT